MSYPQQAITVEDVARNPGRLTLGMRDTPSLVTWPPTGAPLSTDSLFYVKSPDDSKKKSKLLQLYRHDLATGKTVQVVDAETLSSNKEEELSQDEILRRERRRQLSSGITSYVWASRVCQAATSPALLIPFNNSLFISHDAGASFHMVFDSTKLPGPVIDPKLTADGQHIGFVSAQEVYIVRCDPEALQQGWNDPVQVTSGARGTHKTNGIANYLAQEEMNRSEGFWISGSAEYLAFEECSDDHIEAFRVMHLAKDQVGQSAQEDLRYPFAGAANPVSRLAVTQIHAPSSPEGRQVRWMDTTSLFGPETYLCRVQWIRGTRGGTQQQDILLAVLQNREQTELALVEYDLTTGGFLVLMRESQPNAWVNLSVGEFMRPIEGGRKLLWGSERSGFQHLYLIDRSSPAEAGGLCPIVPLTSGEGWVVDEVRRNYVDELNGLVYFLGNKGAPLEKHLFAVSLAGQQDIRRVTVEGGVHTCEVDPRRERFVDLWSSADGPYRIAVKSLLDGATLYHVYDSLSDTIASEIGRLGLTRPVFQSINTTTTTTTEQQQPVQLHMCVYTPRADLHGPGPYPLVVSCYGGPHVQLVRNAWESTTADMRVQLLVAHGYVVMKIDNRGSARRGLAFEGAIKGNMGDLEVQDQVAGVATLVKSGLVDPNRVAIYGWSYGGYLSAMCLARAPDVFKVAIAGAPVTSWDGYDTHYTERYMMTPQSNPAGYASSSVMNHAHKIRGKLMLLHGLVDENVHFRHSVRLIETLIEHQIDHEVVVFPNERHLPRSLKGRTFMETKILRFLLKNL